MTKFSSNSDTDRHPVIIKSYLGQTVEEYSRCLHGYDLKTKQLSGGYFGGRSTLVDLGDVSFARRRADVSHSVTGSAKNIYSFIFPLTNVQFFLNSSVVDENKLAVTVSGKEFYSIIPKDMEYILITLRSDSLSKFLSPEDEASFIEMMTNSMEKEITNFHKSMATQYIYQIYLRMFWSRDNEFKPYSAENYSNLIILYLYEFLSFNRVKRVSNESNYERILTRAIAFINENGSEPIDLNELSSAIYASKRSIQYAFSRIIGMSPLQFMKTNRLNLIREELLQLQPSKIKLSDILNKYQISNHGRFNKEYSKFFEEPIKQAFYKS